MKNYFYYLFVFISTISCDSSSQEYDLAIKNVTLFDSKTKELHKNKTILIQGDIIADIIEANQSFKASKTIEGNGKLVTPGFIDTHTHLGVNYGVNIDYATKDLKPENLEMIRRLTSHQYLNEGVTTIIDMGQPENWMDITMNWQKNPTPEHPNLFNCGGSIVSDEDRWQPAHHIEVKNPEDGRKKVREYAAKGLKHMKLYRKLKKPDMIAMVDEAKKYDITINTHVDNNVVTIPEAMDFGISNFEHFFTLIPSVLSYDDHWPAMNKEYGIQMNGNIDEFTAHMVFFFSYIKDHPEFDAKLKALFDRMAKEGATISTAVNVLASVPEKTDFFSSFEYFPIRNEPIVSYNKDQDAQLQTAFKNMMEYVKLAHDKGVKIRIGTDCRFGGRSLLSELKLFYEAGMSIADILQIATWNGYEAMKIEDQFGSIEVGKKADMLIFEKSPFDNYENFLAKKTIIKDGKIFSLKKSIAYELEKVMVFDGVEAGKKLFNNAKNDESFGTLDSKELESAFLELTATGKTEEAIVTYGFYKDAFPKEEIIIDDSSLVNATYALLRERKIQEAIAFNKFAEEHFSKAPKTTAQSILISVLENGVEAGKKRFQAIKSNENYRLDEAEMNGVGYLLMQLERTEAAILFFTLNVETFPKSWNAFDSLGEAYATIGNKKLAIKNYEKSIALNSENTHGVKALKKLKGE